jgi:hypothetical protein
VGRQVRDSDSPADQPLPANSQAAHVRSILRAQALADLPGPAVRQLLAHVPVLARVPDSELAQALEHVRALAAHLRPAKHRARSARVREAEVEASSSIPRPKKAQ